MRTTSVKKKNAPFFQFDKWLLMIYANDDEFCRKKYDLKTGSFVVVYRFIESHCKTHMQFTCRFLGLVMGSQYQHPSWQVVGSCQHGCRLDCQLLTGLSTCLPPVVGWRVLQVLLAYLLTWLSTWLDTCRFRTEKRQLVPTSHKYFAYIFYSEWYNCVNM